MQWFSVDRIGLSKVASRRALAAAVWELVSNSLDAPGTTRVDVALVQCRFPGRADITFSNLSVKGAIRLLSTVRGMDLNEE